MESIRKRQRIGVTLFILGLAAVLASGLSAQGTMSGPKPMMQAAAPALNGSISAINGTTLFVTTADGSVKTLTLTAGATILGRAKSDLASIKPGEALGVAATRDANGKLSATAINVFTPEMWQQVRKGQFPMANGQVMTNAQVTRLGTEIKNRSVELAYEMLTVTVSVPDNVDIHRMVAIQLAALKIGQKISARGSASADGSFAATSVTVDL